MPTDDKVLDALKKQYETVVKRRLENASTFASNNELHQTVEKMLEASKTMRLDAHKASTDAIDQRAKMTLETLEKEIDDAISQVQENEASTEATHKEAIEKIDSTLEKKRNQARLREEKTDNAYQQALDRIDESKIKAANELDKMHSEAEKLYTENIEALNDETREKKETIDREHKKQDAKIDESIETTKTETDKEITSIDRKIAAYEKTLKEDLEALLIARKKAVLPLEETVRKMKADHDKARKQLERERDEEIERKRKYKKEKEKLNDRKEANKFGKEIKALLKQKEEAIEALLEKQKAEREPHEKERDTVSAEHEKAIAERKKEGIEKIKSHLISRLDAKTAELIDVNTQNTESLKATATMKYDLQSVVIDDEIQRINFKQTFDEATLKRDTDKSLLTPVSALEQEDKKEQYESEKNTIERDRNLAKATHKKETELANLKRKQLLYGHQNKRKRLASNHTYDKALANHNHTVAHIEQDYEQEKLLLNHYTMHAKSYTALKHEDAKVFNPSEIAEIENRKKLRIEHYRDLMKKAENDHKYITLVIRDTHEQEKKVVKSVRDAIEQEHQAIIERMMTNLAKERNEDLEKIDKLDEKNDASLIRRLRRDLSAKQTHHDETLAIKKRDLDHELALYDGLMKHIDQAKNSSVEEADTLLTHILDKLTTAIESIEKESQEAIKQVKQLRNDIRESANLFDQFQQNREAKTLKEAAAYASTRKQRAEQNRKEAELTKEEALANLKLALEKHDTSITDASEKATRKAKQAAEEIEKTAAENLKAIEERARDERRKLNTRIDRERREYEQKLKALNEEAEKAKNACFERKAQAEKSLSDTLTSRDEEAAHYTAERERLRNSDVQTLENRTAQLIAYVRKNPLNHINTSEIPRIRTKLDGDEPIETLDS